MMILCNADKYVWPEIEGQLSYQFWQEPAQMRAPEPNPGKKATWTLQKDKTIRLK